MNTFLWIVQIVAGLGFLAAGFMKATRPKSTLAPMMPWANDFTESTIKLIGVAEVLGGLGLILPWATGLLPWLTPLAAGLLAVLMIGAIYTHVRRQEIPGIVPPLVLTILSLIVLWGRR